MANNMIENFPVWGLLPKKETGVTSFLTKNSEYDGRGVIIAIFDSGVDPGAPGLQTTTTREDKLLERFDCSGAGDVDTNTIVQATNGTIKGITGRTLKIPSTWKNPSGNYHIGVKNPFELYPCKLRERIQEHRKEKLWDPEHRKASAEATKNLQEFETNHTGILTTDEKTIKEDLEARVELLSNFEKKYNDVGPTYDCIVFNDGEVWRACLDTTENGDLEKCKVLGEYSKTHEFAALTEIDQFNISVNVYDNGNLLEVVGMCSGHGTHVACIAAAHFPDEPERNGVAPGAQIISCTIGDARLGSMETGTALVRAMIKIMEMHLTHRVHVINMSYGEHAHWSNTGRIGELMNEIVNKYGVAWVVSAGNHGPALCTIGTPPDISQTTLIGVGAYVSPEMMIAEYSLRQKLPGMPYTWSSRGPTIDGDFGVTVCAPGAAITSVPNFTLRNCQLLNGTSMSSPHVAGAVGLLISGMLQKKLNYSPYSIKRALENSAQYLDSVDPFAQGRGLLQVEKAFELLTLYHDCQARDVRFAVSCSSAGSKGIHIRGNSYSEMKDFNVIVEPFFMENNDNNLSAKIRFSVKLAFVCKESYVQCPTHLDLMNIARNFSVRIDHLTLPHGVHTTCVEAYEVDRIDKGPLFRVPITIVRPITIDGNFATPAIKRDDAHFEPNTIQRIFLNVPEGATWAVLKLKIKENDRSGRFMIHCMQIQPKQSCKTLESQKMWNVSSQTENLHGFKVKAGLVLEVVIAKYWANLGDVTLMYSLSFYGLKPEDNNVIMHAADGLRTIQIKSARLDEIAPVVTLKNSIQPIRPTDSKINSLSSRDIILPGRQIYDLVLTYTFHIAKATEVMPNCAIFSDVLYESEFESQLWYLYDSNKQVMAVGDAYPNKYVKKLEKGDYTLKLQIRHDKKELLEKYVDVPLLVSQKLPSPINLDIYASQSQAVNFVKKMSSAAVSANCIYPIYIAPLNNDKIAKGVIIGQYLTGTITYAKDEIGKKVDVYPFKYVLCDLPKKSVKSNSNGASTNNDKTKTKTEDYYEALREFMTQWLTKLGDNRELSEKTYKDLKEAYPDYHHLFHVALLQSLDPWELKKQAPSVNSLHGSSNQDEAISNKIEEISNEVINNINQKNLLAFYGMKLDNRQDASKIKTEMDKKKVTLVEMLARKGILLCRRYFNTEDKEQKQSLLSEISNIWTDLLKYVDANDNKVIFFSMWHAAVYNHYGRLVKYLYKYGEEKTSRELETKIAEALVKLDWPYCAKYILNALPTKYPNAYRIF